MIPLIQIPGDAYVSMLQDDILSPVCLSVCLFLYLIVDDSIFVYLAWNV